MQQQLSSECVATKWTGRNRLFFGHLHIHPDGSSFRYDGARGVLCHAPVVNGKCQDPPSPPSSRG
jgi:hypothetical protein